MVLVDNNNIDPLWLNRGKLHLNRQVIQKLADNFEKSLVNSGRFDGIFLSDDEKLDCICINPNASMKQILETPLG